MRQACALLLCLLLAGCAAPTPTPVPPTPAPLTIYADSATANVLRDIRTAFLQIRPGGGVDLAIREPAVLRTQLTGGAPADLVLTADAGTLTALQQQSRLGGPPRIVAHDPLVVFVARANPKQVERIEDLNRGDLQFAVAETGTTLGDLTRALVENFRTDAAFGPDFPALFNAGVRDESKTGDEVLQRVLAGEADVGIVLASQANDRRDRIRVLEITQGLNVVNDYSAAPLLGATDPKRAQEFLDFLFAPQAQTLWQDYGFEPTQ